MSSPYTADALPSGGPSWLADLRKEALAAYQALPVPSQDTEEWRYTDLSGLDLDAHPPAEPATERSGEVPGAVTFASIDDADPDLLEKTLHTIVPHDRTRFTALHAAFRTGGTIVHVPRNTRVDEPLRITTTLEAGAAFPHTLIVAEEGADVTLIDRYASGDAPALCDAITEIHAGPGSRVRYVSLQDHGPAVTHLAIQRTHLARDAQLHSTSVAFGAALSRTEVEAVLGEPGATSEMLGVYFSDGTQHYDHRSLQEHAAPHCTSDLLYKGALRDASRAVYSGLIRVLPGAQRTNAMQTNRNIVLSERAKADSIPNLEIEANDVVCGHAASVGPVAEDELFYLQSRGIPRSEAERLIVRGFFQEVLDKIPLEDVREGIDAAIEEELRR